MITLTETVTTTRTLDTPAAIADHVHAEYLRRTAAAPFKPGDRVRIERRGAIPAAFLVGDVGTVALCDPEFSPMTTLIGVNDTGMTIQ